MINQQQARAARREAKWLPRLVCGCRDLPDIVKFARIAAHAPAPAACRYGAADGSPSAAADEGDVAIDMGLVSVDQAMMEAAFASEVCADLSLACAVYVSGADGVAWAGPGATVEGLVQACSVEDMVPGFAGPFPSDAGDGSLLSALLCDPTPLARLQTVSLCGHIQWLSLQGQPEMLERLCAGTPDAGIISRLELRLQPAAVSRGSAPLSSVRPEGPLRCWG
ncbi:hypothetical protein [Aurantimonas sp. HBX-1]|uniref:hypothetical protein n=1 Tax=Aurantimonas sp. HBX-1 TaxID=2906072 RepID=UPI001F43AB6F|nr:hypothetical protein [Aurantimonas sp. HBX-1]UIJ72583.1 hypothetical protein LXB15_02675 [Aurantimonas sp. HBX-1]